MPLWSRAKVDTCVTIKVTKAKKKIEDKEQKKDIAITDNSNDKVTKEKKITTTKKILITAWVLLIILIFLLNSEFIYDP
mgnify:CR=1 FL=1